MNGPETAPSTRRDRGPGNPNRGPAKIDPKDRDQLAESPVCLRRVAGLFRDHKLQVAIVTGLIVDTVMEEVPEPEPQAHTA